MTGKKRSPRVQARTARGNQIWPVAAVCVALAAVTFAVFGQTLTHDFVNYDDDDYVYENTVVARGLTVKGLIWAFDGSHADNWHPLTWLSHMADCQLYGLNPTGHHLTNIILHSVTAMLLFLVLREMTGAFWRSAIVAAIFAIHPLRVESVAWVAERKDVLSGMFFMLTIAAYVRYARRSWSWSRYGLVMLLFALGLMAKPMLVTTPLVLLLLDYWPLRRALPFGKLLTEKVPLFVLSALSCAATLWAEHRAVQSIKWFPLPSRLANAVETCIIYPCQTLWPSSLAVLYPYPTSIVLWKVLTAGVLVVVFSFAAWRFRRRQPWLLVGWLWYLVMLLPVVGIVQVGGQAHADRYTYLPGIGLLLAGTWAVAEWSAAWKHRPAIVGAAAATALAALMVCAWEQTGYWQNSETLWSHTLADTTGNSIAHYNLGTFFAKRDRNDEAINQFQKELEITPDDPKGCYNLGLALFQTGQPDDAIAQYQKAIQIQPDFADAHYNLGIVLAQKTRLDDAIAQFKEAVRLNPNYVAAHVNLANALLQKGDVKGAIAHLQLALQVDPSLAQAENDLANAFLQEDDSRDAVPHFERAIQLEPSDPWVKNNFAWLLATSPEEALRNGKRAVELAREANDITGGNNPIVLHTLAAALAEAGRYSEAVETAQHALLAAESQSRAKLVDALKSELKLYRAGQPLHTVGLAHELNSK